MWKCRVLLSISAAISLVATASTAVARGSIALTFDDLPALTNLADQPYVDYLNDSLLRSLRRHRFPAIGFVNEGKLGELQRARQIQNLEKWLDAGMTLGNHTFSHESPNTLGAAGYVQDIAKGEPVTRGLLAARHKPLTWFRHPYLETGSPEATKRAIDTWLGAHGYRIAPVTMDANDWEFAEPYDDAIARHDERRRLRIKAEYIAYTDRTIAWYQSASSAVFGRQIAFVILLHASRLNADSFDDLAVLLKRHKLKPVTLEEAMKDPAYRLTDTYSGPDGIDWMERWSTALDKPLPWSTWQDPPEDIVREYNLLNTDQRPRGNGRP